MPKDEQLNVLTVLASGADVRCVEGRWQVILPPAYPGASTAISEDAVRSLSALGHLEVSGGAASITPEGSRVLSTALQDAWSFAARWPIPSAGVEDT